MQKIPKTKLEIELTCEKIFLLQQIKKLQSHLQAVLKALDEALQNKAGKINYLFTNK